jgi:tetratricopeptide (TPR) repeat protein
MTDARVPEQDPARRDLGFVLSLQGKLAEAVVALRQALVLLPKDAQIHSQLGSALARFKKVDEAIASLQRAIQLDPKCQGACRALGILLTYDKEDYPRGITALRQAVRLDPRDADAYYHLGNALGRQGEMDEATRSYERVISLQPGRAEAYNNLGYGLYLKGKIRRAIACYRRAIDLDTKDLHAHNNLGKALVLQKEWAQAEAAYRKALALAPRSTGAHIGLAGVLEQQGARQRPGRPAGSGRPGAAAGRGAPGLSAPLGRRGGAAGRDPEDKVVRRSSAGPRRWSPPRGALATPLAGAAPPRRSPLYGTAATTRRLGFLPTLRRITSLRRARSRIDTSLLSTLLTQQYLPSGLNVTQFGPWPTPTLPTIFLARVS